MIWVTISAGLDRDVNPNNIWTLVATVELSGLPTFSGLRHPAKEKYNMRYVVANP